MNTDILYIMLGYIIILVVTVGALQWITKGFIFKYLKVKASRGRLQLILIDNIVDTYWGTGEFNKDAEREGIFTYKNRNKVQKVITNIQQSDIRHIMGVPFLMINDSLDKIIGLRNIIITEEMVGSMLETGLVITKEMVGKVYTYQIHVPACSPQKADFFIDRAMKLPAKGGKQAMLIIGLIVFAIILIIVNIYMAQKSGKICEGTGAQLGNISKMVSTIL